LSEKRIHKLQDSLADTGLDALLISRTENRRYLSGFTGSSGWLLISSDRALLATDFRYTEQAKRESPDFELIEIKNKLSSWLPAIAQDRGWSSLGFETSIAFSTYQELKEAAEGKLTITPAPDLAENLRRIKEPAELEIICRSAHLADAAFEYIKTIIHPEMREKDVAWELEKFLRQEGSEAIPFEIIVASGPNSALPHAHPSERTIRVGEPILIDMGARIDGYCSDFSRTFSLGKDEKLDEIYSIVLEAQLAAINGIQPGMSTARADQIARDVIDSAGYREAFGHSLGHGVGLEVHELPTLSANSQDVFTNGMVFTVEPGIYLPGWGGVRIEDMVTLDKDIARVLTTAKKDIQSVNLPV
jgi:Xaa-Pro aminopeptidase